MEISRNLKKSVQKLYETFGDQSRKLEKRSYIGLVECEFLTKDHQHLFLIGIYKRYIVLQHYNYPESSFDIPQYTLGIEFKHKEFYKIFQTVHGYLIDFNFEETLLKYMKYYDRLL